MGRVLIMCELNEDYVKLILKGEDEYYDVRR